MMQEQTAALVLATDRPKGPCVVRNGCDLALSTEQALQLPRAVLSELERAQRAQDPKAPEPGFVSLVLLEGETKRIAHALHDETGQLLTLLGLKLAEVLRHAPEQCSPCLLQMGEIVCQLERQIRDFSHELRPPMLDDYGLVPTLEYLAQGVSERTGIQIKIQGATAFSVRPPSLVEIVLYRSVQEALINVSRHARARHVTIRFRRGSEMLHCTVRDDGKGFAPKDAERRGLGLPGMRQRIESVGGHLVIKSRPGQGATLTISVPVGKGHCHVH